MKKKKSKAQTTAGGERKNGRLCVPMRFYPPYEVVHDNRGQWLVFISKNKLMCYVWNLELSKFNSTYHSIMLLLNK